MATTEAGPIGGRRVTMKMVADAAGVHVSTVSRVLNRTSGGTEPAEVSATEKRVLAVAGRLGYVPDMAAASLRSQRTRVLGVIVSRLTDVVLATVFEGIAAEAARLGYQAVVANSDDDPAEQRRRIDFLMARRVDGLILGDAHLDDNIADELAARHVPHLFAVRRANNAPAITVDDFEGGRLVGTHLADLGHRRVGIVAGHRWASTGLDRAEGCLQALRERGIDVAAKDVIYSGFDVAAGRTAAERLLQRKAGITAIFAVNDYAALGAMGAARDRGMLVGEDLAVSGYNDIDIAKELPVPLTSVSNPMRELGAMAAYRLVQSLKGEPATSFSFSPRLVVRQSTAAAKP
jgi:LacI family transcriptional regulator